MGHLIDEGCIPVQDPFFGISHANIALRLTDSNWKNKAVMRLRDAGWLYLWISRTRETWSGVERPAVERFTVKVHGPNADRSFCQEFTDLNLALAYINAEDGGRLATETTLATPDQYPGQKGADVVVFTMPPALKP